MKVFKCHPFHVVRLLRLTEKKITQSIKITSIFAKLINIARPWKTLPRKRHHYDIIFLVSTLNSGVSIETDAKEFAGWMKQRWRRERDRSQAPKLQMQPYMTGRSLSWGCGNGRGFTSGYQRQNNTNNSVHSSSSNSGYG